MVDRGVKKLSSGRSQLNYAGAVGLIVLAAGLIETLNGRSLICRCGVVRLWAGVVESPENSQQFSDWYSLSHVVHGLLLYAATKLTYPKGHPGYRLVIACAIEATWEVVENSSYIINRYRAETVSWGYSGDSVLNSVGDILFMIIGFGLASRGRVPYAILLGLTLELVSLVAIRDNLTLNLLMLIHPLASVRAWQAG